MSDSKPQILLVDDDLDTQAFLGHVLEQAGWKVRAFQTAISALEFLSQEGEAGEAEFDVILSDVRMPGMDGLEFVGKLKESGVEVPVIIMTAHGSVETAVQAMRQGAYDYLVKPFKKDELLVAVDSAHHFRKLARENRYLRNQVKQSWGFENIIGKSRAIRAVFDLVHRVAPTNANILITGESGTGKELIACAVHKRSPRTDLPFVAINCSAIPENLLETELFGHAKGAFTGAYQTKKGLFEEAQGGTIFLDEIGDLEMSLQAKILRVLQERTIKPVGSNAFREIDVRIIAATHKDLRAAIKEGRFREDLYYRLSVIPIEIPPLRQRREDIPVLAEHFLRKHCSTHGLSIRGFTKGAQAHMLNHPWEGNVRELENVIERAVLLCKTNVVSEEDLPQFENMPTPDAFLEDKAMEFMSLKEIEKRYIAMILRRTGGKKERAAHILGIDRKTLYRKEKEYGLAVASDRDELWQDTTPALAPNEDTTAVLR